MSERMSFSEFMPCKVRKVLKGTVLSLAGRMPARVPRRMVRFLYGRFSTVVRPFST